MQSSAPPRLVLVSGAPGSGKSTLARRLAGDLKLPLATKDALKEAIADAVGHPGDVAASMRIGVAAYAALFALAAETLAAGEGIVIESNFRRGVSEPELAHLLPASSAVLVHCTAEPTVMERRYVERHASGERHPAHLDADRVRGLRDDLAQGRFEPLELGLPTMVVDTRDGYRPPYGEVLAFAGRASG